MSEIGAEVADPAARARNWPRIAAFAAVLLALVVLGRSAGDAVVRFAEWVQGLGAIGPAVFVAGYAAAVVGFVPGSILTLGAGAVFGVTAGTA